jgi:hypothetical protein
VKEDAGQPWRRLTIEVGDGPSRHLAELAAVGVARVKAGCSPNSLSMGIADLGGELGLGRRVSAYDIRHQRCSDARIAFGGDREMVSVWLGHVGTETARFYSRLPRERGSSGAKPISAVAARPVRVRVPSVPLPSVVSAGA